MSFVKCENCGEEVSTTAAFCTACGRSMVSQKVEVSEKVNEGSPSRLSLDKSLKMPLRQILGLVGSVILFIGVFTPIISLPIVGSMNYFQNSRGDGVIILLLAIFSIFLTLTKRYKFVLLTGIGSLAILVFTYISLQVKISQMQSGMRQEIGNNPFAGPMVDMMLDTMIQIQWGWAVLIVGSVILIAGALFKESELQKEDTEEVRLFGGFPVVSDKSLFIVLGVIFAGWLGYSFLVAPAARYLLSGPSAKFDESALSRSREEAAYVTNVAISDVLTSKGDHFVSGELKNNGDKTLDHVEITIYFLDSEEIPIYETTDTPVHKSVQYGVTSSDGGSLKPNYSRTFFKEVYGVPRDWSEKVKIKVTKVEFAK